MINFKQRIFLLCIVFFFLFSSQEAFAIGGVFKQITKGLVKNLDSINPAVIHTPPRSWIRYCKSQENKSKSICLKLILFREL